jgi:hypothetical protein
MIFLDSQLLIFELLGIFKQLGSILIVDILEYPEDSTFFLGDTSKINLYNSSI